MKRVISLFLILTMVFSLLSGCSGDKEVRSDETSVNESTDVGVNESADVETTLAVMQEESPEIQLLLEQVWIPAEIQTNLDEAILWNEMLIMLENVIQLCDETTLEEWKSIVRPKNVPMERDDGMLAIYEAACVLGIGHRARVSWNDVSNYYNYHGIWHSGFSPREDVFTNVHDISPYEPNPGWEPEWNYITGAQFYSLGQSSVANTAPFFDYVESGKGFNDALTRRDAILASDKLLQAYRVTKSGGYPIPKTDWEDPLLSDAKAVKEDILNSPTTITKANELVLGETYTGNTYFVSNAGNDSNDGLSPETPWATLCKVEKAKLKYGDAVFFQRGGIWYGSLKMQYGVTYSAYGEGTKPIITGSPQDAVQEDKWTLYAETADGAKIWQYAEELPDAGVILLNGGEIVARKAYPVWNEREYTNGEGEPYVVEEELADLMFFSAINLKGKWAPIGTRLSLDEPTIIGPLYLRCDAGNPGQIFEKIEIAVISMGTSTADKGWNTIDNLHFRCFATAGMDCSNHSNIVYQNCEADWCGGAVNYYQKSYYNPDDIMVNISGGGLLLFGHDVTGRNNYIHDCESKGIAVVINGTDGNPAWLNRTNILAEGNVVERCGSSVYMMIEFVRPGLKWKFEDVRFAGNYLINGSYGWRQGNVRDLLDSEIQMIMCNNVMATGEVLFENNLFYRASGTLMRCNGHDLQNSAVIPTMRGNTYVQDKGQMLFVKRDEQHDCYPETTLATSEQALMEKCVREYMGDTSGRVIILE